MYFPHPSQTLTAAFSERPYQGAVPREASFLFIGLDANYDPEIECSPIFDRVVEYHHDGIGFWQRHGVHHPFLLPEYRGDGRRYHLTFSKLGFRPAHAPLVSFAELLHLPTVGRSRLVTDDLAVPHLDWLNEVILDGHPKQVFVSNNVTKLMRASGRFPWMPDTLPANQVLPVLYRDTACTVYLHLHFSNYGKFQSRLDAEAAAIARLIPSPS